MVIPFVNLFRNDRSAPQCTRAFAQHKDASGLTQRQAIAVSGRHGGTLSRRPAQ
jgi:hypothetical protein